MDPLAVDERLFEQAQALLALCRSKGLKIATAESCTGGLVAAALTEVPGSSDVFERAFVTYSNEAKETLVGVPSATIAAHGAVSRECAQAMAAGALASAPVHLAVSITGIAGPGGAVTGKPVGLVHFAAASRGGQRLHEARNYGDIGRSQVRHASAAQALAMLHEMAQKE
jgi:nicotinamide-nucleotide amidase